MSAQQTVIDVVEMNGQPRALLPEARFQNGAPHKKSDITLAPISSEITQGYEWAPWGSNDCLPTEIRQKIEKVPIAGSTIEKLIAMMYGDGIAYYRNSDLADGETEPPRAFIPQVESWLRRNRIALKWFMPQCGDYRLMMNGFSEMITNKRRDMITGLYHKTAEFSRLGKQNQRSLNVEHIVYSPDFALGIPPEKNRRATIPLMPWYDAEEWFAKLKGYKFAWHSRFETPGILYYARPWWMGLFRKNGWIDASIGVPEIVNAMQKNQVILKYQILIPATYFKVRYPDWDNVHIFTQEKREKVIDALIDRINATLSGTDNAFKSISTVFEQDLQGNPKGKIEIIAIDDKVKNNSWVPSSEKSDAQIVQGLGLHPSQMGLQPQGGKMGAGSGSDQRESFNTGINLNTVHQEVLLEPLNEVARFNAHAGFNDTVVRPEWDVTFYIAHTHHTTTNTQEDGMVPDQSTLKPK